ncbi:MAG: N-acetylmuramoyl-L-alanine amidase [Bacillota bacterium]|nr:N-acetylmuramoyl-L-alanine amidase [Bacillota bacterium]
MNINKSYPCKTGFYTPGRPRKIEYIVIHYTGGTGTALQNVQYYHNHPDRQASAHFFVGHKGENAAVYQSVAPENTAWHCGAKKYKHPFCRNSNSIGIEMCCHIDSKGNWYFDDATIYQAEALTKELMTKYGIPVDHVIRHYDVMGKICPAPYVNNPAAWAAFKTRLK